MMECCECRVDEYEAMLVGRGYGCYQEKLVTEAARQFVKKKWVGDLNLDYLHAYKSLVENSYLHNSL